MSEQEQNIEVVKNGYEAFMAGDIETLMSLLDDNIEWIQPGQSSVSGTYHGKGETRRIHKPVGGEVYDGEPAPLHRRRRHGGRAQRNDFWR
jgi:ketosteroid isomerase-like protein